METFVISFKKDKNGMIADDCFQAMISEYNFTPAKNNDPKATVALFINKDGAQISCSGKAIELRIPTSKVNLAEEWIEEIKEGYAEYEPLITIGTDFENESFRDYVYHNSINEKFSSKKNELTWKKSLAKAGKKRKPVPSSFGKDFRIAAKVYRAMLEDDAFIENWMNETGKGYKELEEFIKKNLHSYINDNVKEYHLDLNDPETFDSLVNAYKEFCIDDFTIYKDWAGEHPDFDYAADDEDETDEMDEDFSIGVGAPLGADQGIPEGGDCKAVYAKRIDGGKPYSRKRDMLKLKKKKKKRI